MVLLCISKTIAMLRRTHRNFAVILNRPPIPLSCNAAIVIRSHRMENFEWLNMQLKANYMYSLKELLVNNVFAWWLHFIVHILRAFTKIVNGLIL